MSKINKIVELLIDWENMSVDDVGVEIMSLVSTPAIGVEWQYFSAHEFVNKIPGESKDSYLGRCIPQLIGEGYDQDQAAAICYSTFEDLQKATFESYTDYPDSVKNNAKRGIELNEKVDNKCATQVGKVRAQQLANGEPISEETIRRMYSYLSRAEVYYDGSDPEACGTISYLLWGGKSALTWAEAKIKQFDKDTEKMQAAGDILQLIHTDGFGEVLDPNNVAEIDFTKSKFDTQEEIVDAVVGAAIAGLRDASSEGEVKYRYSGPLSSRPFCAAMLALNKVYTAEELQIMGTTITNGIDDGTQAITRWHGGPHCRHFFEQVRIFRSGRGPVTVVNEGRVNDNDPTSPMYQAGETMASRPRGGYRLAATNMHFSFDGDKRIVTGPAMRAGQLIPRKDEDGNLFHVYFSADTIQKISEKFLEENKQHNTDVNHSMEADTENTLLESWIVANPELDKAKALGFNPTKGDWYVSYKINNDNTWEQIKSGELTGFSIAGQFIELAKTK